jgi:RNA polymerase sigma-70 factor (ECF subfamily)
MYRVATNACLDELRRRGRRPVPGLPAGVEDRHDDAPGFDAAVVESMSIDEALAELPEEYRVAVVLRDVEGMEYAEIAEVLDVPIGTVRSRIARGRQRLATRLSGNQEPAPERPSDRP